MIRGSLSRQAEVRPLKSAGKHTGKDAKRPASVPPGPQDYSDSRSRILIRGARVHNLKNIDLELPRNKLIVFTGVSGSGKSSLAFDTIYAEGQRRFVESLSAYARQFLERMDKPDVDLIQGISPAIAIEQKTTARNPRSTVGTTTEIYDYLRLLFARIGKTVCSACGRTVRRDSVRTVIEALAARAGSAEDLKFSIMFPLRSHPKASLREELDNLKKQGYFRILYKGELIDLNEHSPGAKAEKEKIFILVDRLVYRPGPDDQRLADSIELAFRAGDGHAVIAFADGEDMLRFNEHFACPHCGIRYEEPDPRLFSFNNPFGACRTCQGFGRSVGIDMDLVVPDKELSIRDGAIQPWTVPKWHDYLRDLLRIAFREKLRVDVPFRELSPKELDLVTGGCDGFEGIRGFFKLVERKQYKIYYRMLLSRYRGYTRCAECGGARLRPEALCVKVGGKTIFQVVQGTIEETCRFFERLEVTSFEQNVARRILEELRRRLRYLVDVGIGYLTLDRLSNTLSGGESQRINLATALGSSLVGSLYVLDEPSIGLHPRDNAKLIAILKALREIGNTVIVVEHDADMMKAADLLVDLGPHAGESGGEIVYRGSYADILKAKNSVTGDYLSGRNSIEVPRKRRKGTGKRIVIRGAAQHNLKSIDVGIPLNRLVTVTGVSGSGKSTLVHEILYAGLRKGAGSPAGSVGRHRSIEGSDLIDGVELVDQSPIGRTPRSNPATYIGVFDLIRAHFADTQAAKIHGYTPGSFSFNVPGGRCEACEGSGVQTIEMQFLADLQLTCDVCKGKRFRKEVLEIRYREKNIDEVLSMTVTEAIHFFGAHASGRRVAKHLQVLEDVGMGYIRLGQSATTLSGGEAQRVKLATHLANREQGNRTLFIFDEPTTGLHFDDIAKLLKAFNALIEKGNSVLIIEHNMDVIKCADWIIDLGPEAGERGGEIVAEGTPEEVAACRLSHTGEILKTYLS